MQKFPEKLHSHLGLSLAKYIAPLWCTVLLFNPAVGQETPTSDDVSFDANATVAVPAPETGALQPIFWDSIDQDITDDLPSYRMAKNAETITYVDQRQPLPIPSSRGATRRNQAREQVNTNIPQLSTASSGERLSDEPSGDATDVNVERLPSETLDTEAGPDNRDPLNHASQTETELTVPTTHGISSPTQWNRLELQRSGESEQTLANPLQRYEPLFRHDRDYTSAAQTHPYGTIPLVLNRHVERNLDYFQVGIRDRFQGYLDRFAKYKNLVQQIFLEFGLPQELGYLSLVESGFNPRAYSRARASGPWQFMKATGRMYGLHVNWYVDERRDPVKSTIAAAHHLKDLYDQFGSWPLALGAYNAGGGKISRAIRRIGTRDFWKIRRTRSIRRETKEYVPRFIAATLIASNPTDYGFDANTVEPYAYDVVRLHKRVHLKAVGKATGISDEALRELNPELRRSIVPSVKGGYALKVPAGMGAHAQSFHDHIQPWTQPPPPPTQWYRVRYGDSLSVVAKRFRMTVRKLKRLNNLSRNLIRVGTRLRVRADVPPVVNRNARWYTVRRGDNLSEIAKKFGTTTRALRNLNNLSGHLIHAGDKLRLRGTAPASSSGEEKWYRVRRGDSLWKIARRFSVSVTDLKILNNLRTSAIRVGHLLLVRQ